MHDIDSKRTHPKVDENGRFLFGNILMRAIQIGPDMIAESTTNDYFLKNYCHPFFRQSITDGIGYERGWDVGARDDLCGTQRGVLVEDDRFGQFESRAVAVPLSS